VPPQAPRRSSSFCSEFPRGFSIASNMPDPIFFVLQLRIGRPVRWVLHASMPCLTYTLKHNHLTHFLVCEFLCQPQACQNGTFRKRTLHMMCLCLSLAALGLVSLAGCEVNNPSHFNTEAETMQVPSLSEHLFRPKCCCSLFFLRHSYRGVLLNC
jgi:hypothetical protein